jgi:hypothetical protein
MVGSSGSESLLLDETLPLPSSPGALRRLQWATRNQLTGNLRGSAVAVPAQVMRAMQLTTTALKVSLQPQAAPAAVSHQPPRVAWSILSTGILSFMLEKQGSLPLLAARKTALGRGRGLCLLMTLKPWWRRQWSMWVVGHKAWPLNFFASWRLTSSCIALSEQWSAKVHVVVLSFGNGW